MSKAMNEDYHTVDRKRKETTKRWQAELDSFSKDWPRIAEEEEEEKTGGEGRDSFDVQWHRF